MRYSIWSLKTSLLTLLRWVDQERLKAYIGELAYTEILELFSHISDVEL